MDKYTRPISKTIGQTASSSKDIDVEVIEMVEDDCVIDETQVRSTPKKRPQDKKAKPNVHLKEKDKMLVDVKDGQLLILENGQELSVIGLCTMSVLCGSVSVFGYHCDASKPSVELISTVSTSLLKIICGGVETGSDTIHSVYTDSKLEQNVIDRLPSRDVAVVKLSKLEALHIDFIISLRKCMANQLFGGIEDGPHGRFSIEPEESKTIPRFNFVEDHNFVLDKWKEQLSADSSSVIITCGDQGQGKSTLTQFILNSTLNDIEKVCFLDCDPGQTEFNPPGSVCLHTINSPALGPSFSRQREPTVWCFNGCTSPGINPHLYIQCINHCFHAYKQMKPRPPLIINTMGWMTGLGLSLLAEILRIVQPDLMVQIDPKHSEGDVLPLTPSNMAEIPGLSNRGTIKETISQKDYGLIIIKSVVDKQSRGQNKRRQFREFAMMSYFAMGLPEGILAAKPYIVSWSRIAIHVCHETVPSSQILEAINACVVALCCLDSRYPLIKEGEDCPWFVKKTPACDCVGYGFVRGIDREKKCLYIVTPVALSKLESVNLLMRGDVNLSEELFLESFTGVVPYVDDTATATGASSLRQRKRLPRKTRAKVTNRQDVW
ncbi:polynucleotide 5'-hydroxyl-kinase NOL9-like [Ylistrum balloti]|uniref:polynucleotide 5'-hydroxyl-kinase NOL9-like n=1 Tax=Ylistrum balloti TaxID=509963 RepID=UPI002905CAB4|nr:polynucleotide 5'-hydroxyl-kinase NOL9-like [Ylistrum balloti]